VWGTSGNDVFAVGNQGTILHYDGISWSTMNSGTTRFLTSVWGSSSIDVYAVGSNGTILHYDGISWSKAATPATENLNDIWGASGTDVFVVGDYGQILHYTSKKPNPDIKANGLDGPVTISTTDTLAITVSLDPGSSSGFNADWWVYAETPFGSYYYDVMGGSLSWISGLSVTAQGALIDLSPYEVLTISGLPIGTYTFHFEVDENMNGVRGGQIHSDSLRVTVTE
jgi:hypothetical protein